MSTGNQEEMITKEQLDQSISGLATKEQLENLQRKMSEDKLDLIKWVVGLSLAIQLLDN